MSFWIDFWRTSLWDQWRDPRRWGLLLLLPLLTFGTARLAPAQEVSAPVQVGVVLPEKGGGDFWRLLEARSGLVVVFHKAGLDQARRQVAAGRWDCALVLPEDFSRRLEDLQLEGLLTLLIAPGSAVYPLVRETAAACVVQCVSPGMAAEYLLDSGILTEGELARASSRLEEVLPEGERVLVSMETADGRPLDPLALADRGVSQLLTGLTAILLAVWSLLTAMDLGRWRESPFAQRLIPLRGAFGLMAARLGAALLPALVLGGLALLPSENPLGAALALVPYLLFLGSLALALARCRPAWNALPVLMPFVPVLGLLLSPVLLDLSLLFPGLSPLIRWWPVTLYLRASGGSWGDGLALAAGGAAILALIFLIENKKSPTAE
ncbi:hypothetical protein D1646_01625 [Pseudoflavonifractor sp. 60]|uniref:hypothetical protein n=1 Tax=Pseudoflavonifractor sp. 60 TaxID=2304576 RepID=UPI00136EF254|nr:hypothetical protein [Pseudoflavonifractor sp. 60]NBI65524.1 hypothetical protein [Pseudoflavonifractor sp. 60]